MPRIAVIWHAAVIPAYRKLLEELHAVSGAEVHLIVPPRWPEAGLNLSAPAGTWAGYVTHVLRTWFIGRHYLYFMPGLGRKLRELCPDLIYCYSGPYWLITFWTMYLVRRHLPGTRVIFVSDQTLFKQYPFPFSWMERWVMHRADFATSCDAEGIQRLAQKGFPADRAEPVPLGFDAQVFFPAEGGVSAAPLRILYAGRLLAMKGIADLLEACALLKEPFQLEIAGDGPEREALERQAARLGVPAQFHGARPMECIAQMMRDSDVLVLPSRTIPGKWKEQFGRVLVEAMAAGCVPVGSDSGAIPSVVGPAGLTFPEGDVQALAARLTELALRRDRLADLRGRALERARVFYSWRAVAERIWDIMQRTLALPARS